MKTISKLTAVDYDNYTGKFYTRKETDKKWTVYTVNIDPFLMYRIVNGDKKLKTNQRLLNFEFVSIPDSPVYSHNPFQLNHFIPMKDSTIPEHYTLTTVDHFTAKLRQQINMKMLDYESVAHLLNKFVREQVCEFEKMLDPSKRPYVPAEVKTAVVR